MYSIKKSYKILTVLICMVGFIMPLLLKDKTDSWNSIFSTSFTILQTLISIATLFIAILLYDRFGINAKFKEKQVDKIIELASLLEVTTISVASNQLTYFIHTKQAAILRRVDYLPYKNDC